MDGSKNIHSENTEQETTDSTNRGSFFKKYQLLMPQDSVAVNEPIFKRFEPPRIDPNPADAEAPVSLEVVEPLSLEVVEARNASKENVLRRAPIQIWWSVAGLMLILAGWMFSTVFWPSQKVSLKQIEATNSALNAEKAISPETASAEAKPGNAASEDSGKPEDVSRPVQSSQTWKPSSILMLHNTMLARAREFEDRGLFLLAEQEYRAASDRFPGDTMSQLGLKRVQAVLSAKQQDERSRDSRELGLRAFRMSDFVGAEKALSDAVNAGRADTTTLYALGMSYVKTGSYTKARVTLERCMSTSPDYAPAMVGLAEANTALGNNKQALPLLQRALELGGGAEFTPTRITEMISKLDSEPATPAPANSPAPTSQRAQPTFFARAIHGHDLVLASCRGELKIVNSVVHFDASTPSHSFHVLASEVTGAHLVGQGLRFYVNGRIQRFSLTGRSGQDFLDALPRKSKE